MSTLKFFPPPGSRVESDAVVRLSDGTRLPSWVFIAVPVRTRTSSKVKTQKNSTRAYVDVVTGALTSVLAKPGENSLSGGFKTDYDVSGFSRTVPFSALVEAVTNALPALSTETPDEVDPGFFESPGSTPVAVVTVDASSFDGVDTSFAVGSRPISDYLVSAKVPQTLTDEEYSTRKSVAQHLTYLAVNVVDRLDSLDPALQFVIHSGYVKRSAYTPDDAAHFGQSVRVEFSGTSEKVYAKASAAAAALPYDELFLDYRSGTTPLVTFVLAEGSQRRKLATRYDDVVVSEGRLLNLSRNSTVSAATEDPTDDLSDVHYDEDDDYTQLVSLLQSAPEMFGGFKNVTSILSSMGVNPNPFVSGSAGSVGSGAASAANRSALSSAVTCPDEQTDPKLFPTASNPALRRVSDLSQLDDSATQNTVPFCLRANNPMKVKKVEGVTDLKTRFGYLGEAEGIAVYQDHVGGAAAGMNYVMTTSPGKTMASATRSLAGTSISKDETLLTKEVDDVTKVTAARLFSGMSKHIFGAADPSGVIQQCATIKPNSMESMVSYCAALSKVVCATQTSPLTHDEWASAYQIAKNEPNGHLKKSSTGADLPVTEESNTIDTGVMTPSQSKHTRTTVDYEKRGKQQTWNPVSNYTHYADNLWGANGSNWIASGIISYEQKTSNTDLTKMAQKYETQEMNQSAPVPTDSTTLDWTPKADA